jgi:hypothetical protein
MLDGGEDWQRFLLEQEERLSKVKAPPVSMGNALPAARDERRHRNAEDDDCQGRYVYIHDLPPWFNADILGNCCHWYPWIDMCVYVENGDLGQPVDNADGVFVDEAYGHHFGLDVIFHSWMRQYDCLTTDPPAPPPSSCWSTPASASCSTCAASTPWHGRSEAESRRCLRVAPGGRRSTSQQGNDSCSLKRSDPGIHWDQMVQNRIDPLSLGVEPLWSVD